MPVLNNPLVVINYFIYTFYQKWEPNPVSYGVQVTSFLLSINVLEVVYVLNGYDLAFTRNKEIVFILPVLLAVSIINYLVIYKNGKHLAYFADLYKMPDKKKIRVFALFICYFLATIAPIARLLLLKIMKT